MDSLNSSNNSNASFETKIEKLLIEQRLNGLNEKVEEKNQMIQQLFNINERLTRRIDAYETEIQSGRPQPKIENLKLQLQQANNSLKELQNQISQGELENFELEEGRIALQEKIEQQLSQHKKILNEYTQMFQQKISKLEKEKTDLQEIIKEKNQIITRSKAKHSKASAHLKNRKLEIDQIKSDLVEKNEMIQKLTEQIAELKEENYRLQQNNGNLPENDNDFESNGDDIDHGFDDEEQSSEDEGILYDAGSPDEDGNPALPITSAWASIPVSPEEIAEELASMKNVRRRKPGRPATSKRQHIVKKRIQMRKYRKYMDLLKNQQL